jgi:hypothetical protein
MQLKTLTPAVIALALLLPLSANAQRDATLIYDFANRSWASGGAPRHHGKYFVLRYRSQPTIEVTGLPAGSTVTIDESQFTVEPDTDGGPAFAPDSVQKADDAHTVRQTMSNVDGDEVNYTITVTGADGETTYTIPTYAKVYGRLKIDVSGGLLLNMDLADNNFYYEDAGENRSILRKEKNNDDISPTLAVLTHFYWVQPGYFHVGGVAGLGIADNGKTGWYLGGGVLIGDRQRLAISGGLAWRTVQNIKGQYESLYTNKTAVDNDVRVDTSDLVEDRYKQGWFLAFTYNLSSTVTKK